jgi:hypothetical protein
MKPSLGRIVHYLEGKVVHAAMVVHAEEYTVNLNGWDKWGNRMFRKDVAFCAQPTESDDRVWFWPIIPRATLEEIRALGAQMGSRVAAVLGEKK